VQRNPDAVGDLLAVPAPDDVNDVGDLHCLDLDGLRT
jgi:hypothetical protein